MQQPKPLLNSEDVARRLNVEVITVRRLVRRGQLAAYKIGGEFRFSEEDLQAFLAKQYLPARANLLQQIFTARKVMAGQSGLAPTQRTRQTLRHAIREVRRQKQDHMGTEHLLLGLITTKDSLAASVLDELSITEPAAKASQQGLNAETRNPESADSMSDKLKAVLEQAAQEAQRLQHTYLGTEHLLLALLVVPETNAHQILQKLNINDETVRERVLQRIESASKP